MANDPDPTLVKRVKKIVSARSCFPVTPVVEMAIAETLAALRESGRLAEDEEELYVLCYIHRDKHGQYAQARRAAYRTWREAEEARIATLSPTEYWVQPIKLLFQRAPATAATEVNDG